MAETATITVSFNLKDELLDSLEKLIENTITSYELKFHVSEEGE